MLSGIKLRDTFRRPRGLVGLVLRDPKTGLIVKSDEAIRSVISGCSSIVHQDYSEKDLKYDGSRSVFVSPEGEISLAENLVVNPARETMAHLIAGDGSPISDRFIKKMSWGIGGHDLIVTTTPIPPIAADTLLYRQRTGDALFTESTGTTVYSGILANFPIVPSTLSITRGAATLIDDGAGLITGTGLTGTNTINYVTGAFTITVITEVNAQAVTASYKEATEIESVGTGGKKSVTFDFPNATTVRFIATLTESEAVGVGISEAGLWTDAEILFARKTFGLITKSASFIFEFRWRILF